MPCLNRRYDSYHFLPDSDLKPLSKDHVLFKTFFLTELLVGMSVTSPRK